MADSVEFGEGPPAGSGPWTPWSPSTSRRRRTRSGPRSSGGASRGGPGFGPDESAGDFLSRGDEDISVLVRELLRPGSIDEFLAAREALRGER